MSLSNSPDQTAFPFVLPQQLVHTLRAAYATPRRAYHNLTHIDEMLMHYASVSWHDPTSVALAVLFHDAIYEAGRSDNEARSAELAQHSLESHPPATGFDIQRVQTLILLTARHGSLEPAQLDHDQAQFLDCDMAILGAQPERFRSYEREIAAEYAHLPADLYRAGRARFLARLLGCAAIYMSPIFRARLEAQARDNLRSALHALDP